MIFFTHVMFYHYWFLYGVTNKLFRGAIMIYQHFHQNLRFTRQLRHYTQAEMSAYLHMCRQTYTNYETGRRTPTLETLTQLTHILEVPADYLLTGDPSFFIPESTLHILNDFCCLSPAQQQSVIDYIMMCKAAAGFSVKPHEFFSRMPSPLQIQHCEDLSLPVREQPLSLSPLVNKPYP
ncbi:MAG: XRE family transcriptional regulator [Clostridia bacterium]|nr:XRE family transcriptional regulator [Clostridia bacterium]NCC45026.1 XRE family transcriptional regulator [Clostridia bacterium]